MPSLANVDGLILVNSPLEIESVHRAGTLHGVRQVHMLPVSAHTLR